MGDATARRRTTNNHDNNSYGNPENFGTLPLKPSNRRGLILPTRRKSWNIASCVKLALFIVVLVAIVSRSSSESDSYSLSSSDLVSSSTVSSPKTPLKSCSIDHFPAYSEEAKGKGSGKPVLLQGWKTMPSQEKWNMPNLMKRVGHFPQYVKDPAVQQYKDSQNKACILPGNDIVPIMMEGKANVLFFTNNKENEPFMQTIRSDYEAPPHVQHIDGFEVFSAVGQNKSHAMHKHGESWLGQVVGRRMWWFLPPSTSPAPEKVNACLYMTGQIPVPDGAVFCLQNPGDIIWFPTDWYHATCALDKWTVGIGAQLGPPIRQHFKKLDSSSEVSSPARVKQECLGLKNDEVTGAETKTGSAPNQKDEKWKWFGGDLNAYYNSLHKDEKRDPSNPANYAVHRWLGPSRSTEEHYKLIDGAIARHLLPSPSDETSSLNVLDAGCGLGAALMWMEQKRPQWTFTGYTISEEQHKFITQTLPPHKFKAYLQSFDDILDAPLYDVIYSIEALIHSIDIEKTLREWTNHLAPGGIIVLIDDFVAAGADKNGEDMQAFAKSWLANSLVTPSELASIGRKFDDGGLQVIENRDLDAEYRIVELNYRNKIPEIQPFGGRTHQGWMGSKWRQRLTVEGKLTYNLVVFQKAGGKPKDLSSRQLSSAECAAVPMKKSPDEPGVSFVEITPQLMSGKGKNGGQKMTCISGWYCCDKGQEWFDNLQQHRTDTTKFLQLDRSLFGHYITSFTKHLNDYFSKYPASGAGGRFLDIGGTGSTASGMTQVTSKFQHFAGPLEYWKLDSDPAAKSLERTVYCDIDDCPGAETCGFDVTFSHTVLEHAQRPWLAFDTIARITKKGGLTLHLVPFSYQYHATPDDNYRFSHKALTSLLEDRGFEVLEVGYDICSKPEKMLRRVDEHYDVIWLTYVIGRKL